MTFQKKTTEVKEQVRVESDRNQGRKRRGVFSGNRLKLEVLGKKEGLHYAWINDIDNKVSLALDGGYNFVEAGEVELGFNNVTPHNSDEGTRIKTKVDNKTNGEPLYAYLMSIKQEWYQEDKEETNAYLDQIEEQIRGGNIEGAVGKNGRYIPHQGISMKNK